MRIATKIISGYAVLIALMAAVLVYQVVSIHYMQSINKNLSGLTFSAARTSIQLMRDRDLVEEYTKTPGAPARVVHRDPCCLTPMMVLKDTNGKG